MARIHSPGYPNMSLPKAVAAARKIFEADRRHPTDRAVAAKHIGYAGPSGASDKALASLAHYGLTEKTGKGEIRVSQLALDIIHPDQPEDRARALYDAGFKPQVFKDLRERFNDGPPSEETLRSYLIRENFQNIAINPVMNAYFETCRYLEQEKAIESGGSGDESGADLPPPKPKETVFGGAKVGDLVQWEIGGALQLENPMRVRLISEDGQWVAVEGSETGIPMEQVIVEERPSAVAEPPRFKLEATSGETKLSSGETEWMRNLVGRDTKVRLMVSGGEMGPKEIGKLIKLLKAQQAVLTEDDGEDEDDGRS